MKIKEVGMSVSYTFQPEPFHSIRGEASVLVSIDDDDDVELVKEGLRDGLRTDLLKSLAGVEKVHVAIHQGSDPMDLIELDQDLSTEEEDWSDWNE